MITMLVTRAAVLTRPAVSASDARRRPDSSHTPPTRRLPPLATCQAGDCTGSKTEEVSPPYEALEVAPNGTEALRSLTHVLTEAPEVVALFSGHDHGNDFCCRCATAQASPSSAHTPCLHRSYASPLSLSPLVPWLSVPWLSAPWCPWCIRHRHDTPSPSHL